MMLLPMSIVTQVVSQFISVVIWVILEWCKLWFGWFSSDVSCDFRGVSSDVICDLSDVSTIVARVM